MYIVRLSLALLTPLLNVALAGSVDLYTCATGDDPHQTTGSSALIAMRVHYSYDDNECKSSKRRSWDAFSGALPALLGFHTFCGGSDGDGNKYLKDFCGNVDIFPHPGLHIKLNGHDLALGTSDSNIDLDPDSDYAADLCKYLGLSRGLNAVSVSSWRDVAKTTCV